MKHHDTKHHDTKHHDTKTPTHVARLETESSDNVRSDDFNAARVFADPVTYLAGFGLRSELAETQQSGFPEAA